MNIWFVSENWEPTIGGVANYLSHVAAELARHHEVHVFVPSGAAAGDKPYVHRTRFTWPLLKPAWWPIWKTVSKRVRTEKPDFLICGKALFEGRLALRLKQKYGVPYVLCTYAMEIETWIQKPKHEKQLATVLGEAAVITYINEVTKQRLLELGATQEQLVKVVPGVDSRFFKAVAEPLAKSTARHYGIHAPYVISLGRLVRRKGFDVLLRAFANLDQTKFGDVELVIVGDGPEHEELRRIIQQEYLSTSVKLLAEVPDKHLARLLAGAEVFALTPRELPGDIEGFGIVYLEAAAVGTPSVGTRTGGVPEAIRDGETGLLVPPEDEKEITKALESLLDDPALRQKTGAQAQEHAKKHTWPTLVTPLIDALTRQLDKAR